MDPRNRVEGVELRMDHAHSHRVEVDNHSPWVDHGRGAWEAEIGSRDHGGHSIRHGEEGGYGDDIQGGVGSREVEEVHDHSIRLEGKDDAPEAGSENGRSARYVERHPEAARNVRIQGSPNSRVTNGRTSATQRTVEPLKSLVSSFSTATFRSAAVSNSTNLVAWSQQTLL